MKTGHFKMVTMLLSAVILMNIFQVKATMLDMADNAFDDEYQKCTDRMEIKYVPQLLKEEKASHQLFEDVWENAKAKWEARKTHLSLPMSFKDNHGIALMAYISEAQEQTSFYHLFNEAVKMAGQSRKDYIYGFQFKAFHFYLTKALQLLRRPCEDSYKNVVYSTSQGTSFTFGGLNQARFGHFTLAHSAKPQAASDQHILLTIHTCFGVAIGKFVDKENESGRIIIIPLNEIFYVSQDGASNNLILRSTNKTCSHYECAFLGGLKMANCVENIEYFLPIYVASPGDKKQKLEDPGMKSQESTVLPGVKNHEPIQMPEYKSQEDINNPTPAPAPAPVPGPKTHPSASSGKMLLPSFGAFIILISASIYLFVSL
ncbi:ecto-ADP-ribosyltransferase 3 isoform X1 [Myotis daubentonii]|uniref:ecto-ADP-ribosyltransferase 3 isoform X1 n=1 Tax=Myotis daubentonii TaxID=98922 RepID=UPI002872FEAC|nr:ecto-ADP-ribosyltransferase 3 isoform X1 [Myotis daubentonii]XP_059524148.1 ecto-ADP-ribosyltransferase 3 isoform X1 [Myotis daubentonii]XP_059524157.1 ecto-ADP-ribosyltransferase 3 isoform X1 [Myotis daubentonii]XP_059524166.1 ecto-ADP-ribosyltransferase 3 isoform X1 [Myotis daubentonii]XP_059524173.1 ecto-ADP-ribosyltransferase 3 isoform X1 [Myotis daubentonii]XP_059524183.1 ecto-ADP-ribosyltransferase 3 isoform X1 [Myotis daubentonii]XP_059524194.1 ecto-ADP-ribosyltransferase 3 isoform 